MLIRKDMTIIIHYVCNGYNHLIHINKIRGKMLEKKVQTFIFITERLFTSKNFNKIKIGNTDEGKRDESQKKEIKNHY